MHPDPHPPADLAAPRGGTVGPPPALPPNGWQMALQALANAAQQLAQASILRPIFLNLMTDNVNGPAFVASLQTNLTVQSPSMALVAWPFQTQGPSPTAPKTTA
jgi:hypothetical protein